MCQNWVCPATCWIWYPFAVFVPRQCEYKFKDLDLVKYRSDCPLQEDCVKSLNTLICCSAPSLVFSLAASETVAAFVFFSILKTQFWKRKENYNLLKFLLMFWCSWESFFRRVDTNAKPFETDFDSKQNFWWVCSTIKASSMITDQNINSWETFLVWECICKRLTVWMDARKHISSQATDMLFNSHFLHPCTNYNQMVGNVKLITNKYSWMVIWSGSYGRGFSY